MKLSKIEFDYIELNFLEKLLANRLISILNYEFLILLF